MKPPSLLSISYRNIRSCILMTGVLLTVFAAVGLLSSLNIKIVQGARLAQNEVTPTPTVDASNPAVPAGTHSGDCRVCHGMPNFTGTLGDGIKLNLTVNLEESKTNIHYRLGTCGVCHAGFEGYPHPTTKKPNCAQCHFSNEKIDKVEVSLPFENSRELVVAMNNRCYTCHDTIYVKYLSGSHANIMKAGNLSAPLCSDCHGGHAIQPVEKADASLACQKCHQATYSSFMSSVHGAELEKKAPADAPSCADCHGTHTLNGPGDPDFRKNSMVVCLKCHQDKAMMDLYKLPSDIFDTNVDNYHTIKVDILGRKDFNIIGNTPICVDCHGVHSIMPASNRNSTIGAANLLSTCLKCHPGNPDFNVSGSAHISASSGAIAGVGYIETFFRYLIPGIFGLLMLYILLDARKLFSDRKNNE